MKKLFKISLFYLFSFVIFSSAFASEPIAVYLTWQKKPLTSMTIHWVGEKDQKSDDVYYKKESDNSWTIVQGKNEPLPQDEPYLIHTAELENLDSSAIYQFKVGELNSPDYKFKTMSNDPKEEIRFVVGGDLYKDGLEHLIETHKQAAKQNPAFALIGGDIAYTAGKNLKTPEDSKRWLRFLRAWKEHMVTPDGFLIPIIPAIGNHEVVGRYGQSKDQAKFFYSLFAFPGDRGYSVLDFSDFLSIFVLDSNHTNPINGEQTRWLRHVMDKRRGVKYKFALYHVPAYPCVKDFKDEESVAIRKNWVPIFEDFSLTAAFENHCHAYKRTYPLLRGKKDKNGVLYLGNGGWGVKKPRTPKKRWYLEKSAKKRHFILVTIKDSVINYQAIDYMGNVFDHFNQIAR